MLKRGPPPPSPPLSSLVSLGASAGASAGGCAFFAFAVPLGPVGLLARKPDLAFAAVDPKDLDFDLVTDLDDLFGAVDLVVGQLGDMQQALRGLARARRKRRNW